MNTIFFHRADPVTKGGEGGGGGAKNKSALRPYPERRPREFHEWVYPKRAETMAEFGTKATENAHAIRACKPVHVLSLRTSFQTWISFPFSRILLLVRVTIGGEREREREGNFPIIHHYDGRSRTMEQGARDGRVYAIR